jgi:hypothetical protein
LVRGRRSVALLSALRLKSEPEACIDVNHNPAISALTNAIELQPDAIKAHDLLGLGPFSIR